MSRTSLGQKNDLRQRDQTSLIQSSLRRINPQEEFFQTHINFYEELDHFLHLKDRYLKLENEIKLTGIQKDTYVGQSYNNLKEGFGIYAFSNGDSYIGFWDKDQMSTMGVYKFSSLEQSQLLYLGEFLNGKFHGIGKLVKMIDEINGEIIYRGKWSEGQKADHGVHFYGSPNTYYQGLWLNDSKHGEGKFILANTEFVGSWKENLRSGKGKLKIIDENCITLLEGNWQDDELSSGEIIYQNESNMELGRYKGQIHDGKKHGKGIYSWPKGFAFEGQFDNDHISGQGILKNSLFQLRGAFNSKGKSLLENLINLKATITYENKDIFEGTVLLEEGILKRQSGIYKFSNGDVAEGVFKDIGAGKLQGNYTYRWKNGEQKSF